MAGLKTRNGLVRRALVLVATVPVATVPDTNLELTTQFKFILERAKPYFHPWGASFGTNKTHERMR